MAAYFSYFPNVYIGEGITDDENFKYRLVKNIFRIVDFSGYINGISIFAKYASFKKLSKTIHYIDVLLSEASLVDNTVFEVCSSNKYLPLYFEPFISDYKEKNFCFKQLNQNINKNLLIITGDCDQERPNKRYNAT